MQYKKLKCGCEIPIVNGKIHIDYDNLNDQCPKTWELYLNGHTRSIFQLESRLCKSWARELIPSSMKDAADLIAIVRPGTLNSTDENGKSMTKIFCDRKTGKEEFTPDSLYEKLLADTYSIIVYQEQLLFIAKQIAGFDGKMANKLMKGVGKKNAELLFSLEKAFLEGCNNTNAVSQDEAKKIFENIKASARYLFNKSHSYSYAKVGYQTAWVKAHFPEQYICAWLKIAKNEAKPLEEIRGMMSEARRLKIKVYGPSARNLPKTDFFIKDGSVFFGLGSIKDCSDDSFKKIIDAGIDISNMNWMDFLVNASHYLSKSQMVPMIRTGCFDGFSLDSRTKCEFEYLQWNLLTLKQKETLREYYQSHKILSLIQLIQNFLDAEAVKASEAKKKETKTDKYKKYKEILYTLKRPPMDLRESTSNMIENEKQLLGINITCSHIERADIPIGTHSCSDINSSKFDKYKVYSIVGEICEFEEFKIKNGKLTGQTMANFKLYDSEDELDVVVFPEALDRFQAALYEGNIVLIKGKKSNRGGLILEEIYEV